MTPTNAEKSAFFPGMYVVYDGRGWVWHARRSGREWVAKPAPNNPARQLGAALRGATLKAVAALAAARGAQPQEVTA